MRKVASVLNQSMDPRIVGVPYMNPAVKAVGAVLTIAGLLALLYVFYVGATTGSIGKPGEMSREAWLALFGWFAFIIGPALWAGETPVSIKQRLKR